MNPEDVPESLINKAAYALAQAVDGDTTQYRVFKPSVASALAAVLPDVAQGICELGRAMREADGWDEEWSTREVRDALNIAADRIDRKGWS